MAQGRRPQGPDGRLRSRVRRHGRTATSQSGGVGRGLDPRDGQGPQQTACRARAANVQAGEREPARGGEGSMKVRREIASIPVRTAGETWQAIVDLITGKNSVDASTLKAAASVMESLIVDEHPATSPIVVKGEGPRLVIYHLCNEAAMEAGSEIDRLTWNPTGGPAWQMTAPSEAADVDWMN